MRSRILAVLLFVLVAAALPAAAARPMSLDDLLNAVRVSDPQLSPDGKWVAFVRTGTDQKTLKRNADLFLVPSDGSAPPRPLTRDEKSDSAPRFSPDGRTLAFLSTRSGSSQVWLLGLDGGEPRKITEVPGGVETPLVFSPDGRRVAFVADVFPLCADEACNRKRFEEAEKGAREGLPPDPPHVPALGHVAPRGPAPRSPRRPRDGKDDGRHPRRLRLPSPFLRGRRHRLLAGRKADSRSSPTATGTTRRRGRPTRTSF